MRRASSTLTATLVVCALSSGCESGAGATSVPIDENPCVEDALSAQPIHRFPLGRALWLPPLRSDASSCATVEWELVSAPAENANSVVAGDDGYARFTPHVLGEHVFRLSDGSSELTVTVIDHRALSFHNHSYYPTRSVIAVDDEVWAANVLRPTITRVSSTDRSVLGTIDVGGWPVALAHSTETGLVAVAQRGDDTLGLVDVESGHIVDSIWVGDEPSNLVLSPDGRIAYVALATESAVAEVDLDARRVLRRLDAVPDALGLAIAPDGEHLYVAVHRSGHPRRQPYGDDPVEEERDVVEIALDSGEISRTFVDVGTTLKALHVSADGATLYVAGLWNDTDRSLGDSSGASFLHQIVAIDLASEERRTAVTSDTSSADDNSITLHQMLEAAGRLWVVAEGTDTTVAIDPGTLEVSARVETLGRPRSLALVGDTLWVHGAQDRVLTEISTEGTVLGATAALETDPRPPALARGMRYFTGSGRSFARTWSCNSCHADSLTDTIVWNAGPVADRVVPRPFSWLEGTYPLGWAGYLSDVRNYAFTVNNNVGIRPTTEEAEDLNVYISSLMPPPAANGWTRRDGALSDEGALGRALYEGEAGCAGCHALPLTTSRATFAPGITEGVSDVPALVGAYRYGTWMKHGEARTYESGVELALGYVGARSVDDAERARLTRFLRELTGRDFFVLASDPRPGTSGVATDAPMTLTFSLPVWNDPANLAHIRLVDEGGTEIAVARRVIDGRRVELTPAEPLPHGAELRIEVGAALEAEDERRVFAAERIELTTAAEPVARVDGRYVWTVAAPALDVPGMRFDTETTTPVRTVIDVTTTRSGGRILVDYGRDLAYDDRLVVDGARLVLPSMPVPIGPSFGDSLIDVADFVDLDGDGIGDRARGTLVMQGPGFVVPDVAWSFEREDVAAECPEGETGALRVRVSRRDVVSISWAGGPARAVWITPASATLPDELSGTISGGAMLAIEGEAGFASPLQLGTVPEGATDATKRHGGGGSLEAGECYRFSVVTESARGDLVMRWPS